MDIVNQLLKKNIKFKHFIESNDALTVEGFKTLQKYALKLLRKRSDNFIPQQKELLNYYGYNDYAAKFIKQNQSLIKNSAPGISDIDSIKKDYALFDNVFEPEAIKKVVSTNSKSPLYKAMYNIARYLGMLGTFIGVMTFKSSYKRPISLNILEDMFYLDFLKNFDKDEFEKEFVRVFNDSSPNVYFQKGMAIGEKELELLEKLPDHKKDKIIKLTFSNGAFKDDVDINKKIELFKQHTPKRIKFEDADEIREYIDNGLTLNNLADATGKNQISIGRFLKQIFEEHTKFSDDEIFSLLDYYDNRPDVGVIMFNESPAKRYHFPDTILIDRLGQDFVDFLNKRAEQIISIKHAAYVDENYDAHSGIFSKYYLVDSTALNDLQQSNFWGNFLEDHEVISKDDFVDIVGYMSKSALKGFLSNKFIRYYGEHDYPEETAELKNYINKLKKLFNF